MPSWSDSKLKEFPGGKNNNNNKNHPQNTRKKPTKKVSTQRNNWKLEPWFV